MTKPVTSYGDTVLPLVRSIRGMLLPSYGRVEFREKSSVRKNDFVTDLDVAVEDFLKEELGKSHPDILFVGEEKGGDRAANRFWLVDPIDGTSHFIRGLPFCTSQLALIENGEVTFSVVYDFVNDVLYHAEKGHGAFANGRAVSVSNRMLDASRLSTVFKLQDAEVCARYLKLRSHCHTLHVGASGYELSLVASGKLDGAVYYGKAGSKDYDVAPGTFLIREAGGIVANIGLSEYDYRNIDFIAANPHIFKDLTEGPDAIFPIQS